MNRRELEVAATRAEVARRASVSPALVSYVLNDGPRPVSKEARRRIESAIAELDYRPNAVAKALQRGATGTIGMLVPGPTNVFFSSLAGAIEDLAYHHGSTVMIGFTNDDPLRESRYVETFVDHNVDGIIVISSRSWKAVDTTVRANVPIVSLDRVGDESEVSTVRVDNYAGACACVKHIVGHGRSRVGCIGGFASLGNADDRVKGWQDALRAHGLRPRQKALSRQPFTEAGGARGVEAILRDAPDIDALFVSSDVQAVGALSALGAAGLRVPEQVAVVSFDGTESGRYCIPPLTSFVQPVQELASGAVELLLEAASDEDVPVRQIVLPGRLRSRASCGCSTPADVSIAAL